MTQEEMMSAKEKQAEQREQHKSEQIGRGAFLAEMTGSKGWELVISYVTNQVQAFGNKGIQDGFKTMEEYSFERGRVKGLTDLLASIQFDINYFREHKDDSTS